MNKFSIQPSVEQVPPVEESPRARMSRLTRETSEYSSIENGARPEVISEVTFNEFGGDQKFIVLQGGKKNPGIFIVSNPSAHLHKNLYDSFTEQHGKEFILQGGGHLLKNGNTISLFGKSTFFGGFKRDITEYAFAQAYPEMQFDIEEAEPENDHDW